MEFVCLGCGNVGDGREGRRCCSNRCQRGHDRKKRIALWLETGVAWPDPHEGHHVRRHLHQEQSGRCVLCQIPDSWAGKPLVFVLDHVDGDSTNNRRENLRLVCPNCDSQLPTFKARNRGKGRATRRARFAAGKSY